MTKPNIVLLHGVLMNTVEMLYLERQLANLGYAVHNLSYASVSRSVLENTDALFSKINALDCDEFSIVAHSLGGIMALHLLQRFPDLPIKRIVMLGSPVTGSYVASRFIKWPIAGQLLRKSMHQGLSGDHDFKPASCDIGMIAGVIQSPVGMGLLLGKLPGENDGTVLLAETQHPCIKEHITVNKSHTGLIFSKAVCRLIDAFLQKGQFPTENQPSH